MKRFGEFLLAKNASATIVAFLCALLPIFNIPTGFIATIIVGLVTLQKGPRSGLLLLTWVALPAIALLILRKVGTFDLLLLRCILMWIFAALLNRRHSWQLVLEVATVIGIIFIVVLHMLIPNLQQWWTHELTRYLHQMMAGDHWRLGKLAATPALFAARLAPMATGAAAFFILIGVTLELIVARYWQYSLFNPGEFAKEFIRIRAGIVAAILMCILFILVLFKIHVAYDVFPLALLPFFIAGLSLLHFWAHEKRQLIYLLIVIYAGLIFVPAFAVSIVALIAFVDAWFNFRGEKK